VTTLVQQIDAQGPVVVDRITTHFVDVACNEDNARKLVEALHSGSEVTLSADGKTATFTPGTSLGYGEAYIALSLAAEALRNAGVTGCATPEQWQAVLLGGPLTAAGTTMTSTSRSASASSSSSFPGVLALRTQGQGWGQIAQTTNVQLGQVVSSARNSLKIDAGSDANLTPTGRSSAEMNESRATSGSSADKSNSAIPGARNTPDQTPSANSSTGADQGKDKDKSDKAQNDASSSSSANPDSSSSSSSAKSSDR
jgi:hypothetical protein